MRTNCNCNEYEYILHMHAYTQITEVLQLIMICAKAASNLGFLIVVEEKIKMFHEMVERWNHWCTLVPYLKHHYAEEVMTIKEAKEVFEICITKANWINSTGYW